MGDDRDEGRGARDERVDDANVGKGFIPSRSCAPMSIAGGDKPGPFVAWALTPPVVHEYTRLYEPPRKRVRAATDARTLTRLCEPPLRDCFTSRRLLSRVGKRARVLCFPTIRGEAPSPKGSHISARGEAPGQEVRKTRAL